MSEAEAMVHAGVLDVFVSNEVVGRQKLRRLCALTKLGAKISVCVDSIYHCDGAHSRFARLFLFDRYKFCYFWIYFDLLQRLCM